MGWIALVVSGVLETVWAAALSQSRSFTRLIPSVVFGVALVLSMIGLAYALRSIPVGTGYAVWVGCGWHRRLPDSGVESGVSVSTGVS